MKIPEKMKNEPQRAYEMFQKYAKLPPPRDLNNLCSAKFPLQLLEQYRTKWHWDERLRSIDNSPIAPNTENAFVQDDPNILFENEMKNFAFIFSKILSVINLKLLEFVDRSEQISIDEINKQISSILKNLSEYLKIKKDLSPSDKNFDVFEDTILQNESLQKALISLNEQILSQIDT